MDTPLNSEHVRKLVQESAHALPEPLRIEQTEISEGFGEDGPTWIIRFATRRPSDRNAWTRTRLKLLQSVRDRLLARGDNRYPILEVMTPEEWRISHHG